VQHALSDVLLCKHFVSEACLDRKSSDNCVDDLVDELTAGLHAQLGSAGDQQEQQQQQQQHSPPVAAAASPLSPSARAVAIAVPSVIAGPVWLGVVQQHLRAAVFA